MASFRTINQQFNARQKRLFKLRRDLSQIGEPEVIEQKAKSSTAVQTSVSELVVLRKQQGQE